MSRAQLHVMNGGQGSGRTKRLAEAVRRAAEGPPRRPAVVVDPASAWTDANTLQAGGDVTLIRGDLARSADVFDLLCVIARTTPDLIVAFDDAEHSCGSRRRWSALAAAIHSSGGSLFVILADFTVGHPAVGRFETATAGLPARRSARPRYPGGRHVEKLTSAR